MPAPFTKPARVEDQTPVPGVVKPGEPSPASTTGRGTIRGRIIAGDSGRPVRGARVVVSLAEGPATKTQYIFTDNDGRYEATNLEPGSYRVNASKQGYIGMLYGETRPLQGGRTLSVATGQLIDNLNFVLPRGGIITGVVVDRSGEPIARAEVSAIRIAFANGRRGQLPTRDFANDAGEFRLFGLYPGTYYVSASKSVTTGLGTDAVISGHIAYPTTWAPGTEDFTRAQSFNIEPGQTISGVVVSLSTVRLAKITGTVDLEGRPLRDVNRGGPDAVVRTYQAGVFPQRNPLTAQAIDANGNFTLFGVEPGTYELRAILPTTAAVASVTINGEDLSGVRLRPLQMPIVTGRLVIPATDSSSLSLSAVRINAISTDASNTFGWTPTPATVQPDHTFTMNGLPGQWVIDPMLPAGWAVRSIRVGGRDITTTAITLREGENVTDVEIEVTNRVTQITGIVRSASNSPVDHATVLVFARDSQRRDGLRRHFSMVRADERTGRFLVTGLSPGDYYAVALPFVDANQAQNPALLERVEQDATPLSLREGEAVSLDLRLIP
jgi:hypothetical protein